MSSHHSNLHFFNVIFSCLLAIWLIFYSCPFLLICRSFSYFQHKTIVCQANYEYIFLYTHNIFIYSYFLYFCCLSLFKVYFLIAKFFLKKFTFFYLFIYDCVESSLRCEGLSPVAASGDHSSSRCAGLSPSRPLSLRSTGSRRAGSATVAHGPSRSAACGIFPDRGTNPCPLHWQADSQPLRHQGSPLAL